MLHLVKLAPGCTNVTDLIARMAVGATDLGCGIIYTRTKPKRADEILAGGSIYRVIAGTILARQLIIGFEGYTRDDGNQGTKILVAPQITAVKPRPMRPFQGWRYLKVEDAPPDLPEGEHASLQAMPTGLRKALTALHLI